MLDNGDFPALKFVVLDSFQDLEVSVKLRSVLGINSEFRKKFS